MKSAQVSLPFMLRIASKFSRLEAIGGAHLALSAGSTAVSPIRTEIILVRKELSAPQAPLGTSHPLQRRSTMRVFATMTAATAMILSGAASALASCNSPSPPMQVGALDDNPEKNTFGFICAGSDVAQTNSIFGRAQVPVVQIGSYANDPEKDTFGYSQAPVLNRSSALQGQLSPE
jgi:hypothetical protein